MKKNLKYKIILGVTFLAFLLFEIYKPQPIDWRITLSPNDKIPFGTYVLAELVDDLFPGSTVNLVDKNIYRLKEEDSLHHQNIIIVAQSFEPSKEDVQVLLEAIENGTQCLLIAESSTKEFLDTLGVGLKYNFFSQIQIETQEDSIEVRFNKKFYDIPKAFITANIPEDLEDIEILSRTSESDVIFIKKSIGKGKLFLCSTPLLVSNYTLLQENNARLLEGILGHLPNQETILTSSYTLKKTEPQTPIRYLLSQPALKWAFFTGILTLLFFMLFKTKREQRKIPTIIPPKNTSTEFAETVGQLYLKFGNHKNIVDKKLLYLKDYLFSKYFLKVNFERKEVELVAQKTGKSKDEISTLYFSISKFSSMKIVNKDQLMEFNKKLEEFYFN